MLQALLTGNAGFGFIPVPLAGEPCCADLLLPDRHFQQVDVGSILAPQSSWHSKCFEGHFKSGQASSRAVSAVAVTTVTPVFAEPVETLEDLLGER